jgi:glucosamine-phosphate N-acetyltransferase
MNIENKNIEENFIFREIIDNDFNNGYLKLLFEFTNYEHQNNETVFKNYLVKMKNNNFNKIIVITTKTDSKIIGAGTIFKLDKLHNNPIGQIEDIIITDSFRGYGLGKLLIKKLVNIGLNEFNCYKIILNCLPKNIEFYKKCNFIEVGIEMKYNK